MSLAGVHIGRVWGDRSAWKTDQVDISFLGRFDDFVPDGHVIFVLAHRIPDEQADGWTVIQWYARLVTHTLFPFV